MATLRMRRRADNEGVKTTLNGLNQAGAPNVPTGMPPHTPFRPDAANLPEHFVISVYGERSWKLANKKCYSGDCDADNEVVVYNICCAATWCVNEGNADAFFAGQDAYADDTDPLNPIINSGGIGFVIGKYVNSGAAGDIPEIQGKC